VILLTIEIIWEKTCSNFARNTPIKIEYNRCNIEDMLIELEKIGFQPF
jgi:hypothetical protein